MSSKIEILAPAGSIEILRGAVQAGADAVYVGGDRFGARAYADNFNEETLLEAIHFVHLHGKRLYLTINTLFMQGELEELYDFLKGPYEAGLDAVIVQDVGVASYIRKQFPKLALHISTQMTVTSPAGGMLLKELGAARIVPARELSLKELKALKKSTGLELEVFVHGALCYCYSGQCLLSSVIGLRSGNRGRCAQPCRLPYQMVSYNKAANNQKEPYLLSPKDLCALDVLPQLIACGVDSLKIEGRMKNSSYVAAAVSAYRQAVDAVEEGRYTPELIEVLKGKLAEIYNRGGFTEGYFNQHNGRQMMSMERPNHQGVYVGEISKISKGAITFTAEKNIFKGDVLSLVLTDGSELALTAPDEFKRGSKVTLNASKTRQIKLQMKLYRTKNKRMLEELQDQYLSKAKKEKIKIEVIIKQDLCATMKISLRDVSATVQGGVATRAQNQPITRAVIVDKVLKLGNTPFIADDISVELEENVFLPVKELNELRRAAVEALEEAVRKSCERSPVPQIPVQTVYGTEKGKAAGTHLDEPGRDRLFPAYSIQRPVISALVSSMHVLSQVLLKKEVSLIYLDTVTMSDAELVEAADRVKKAGRRLIICMPHIFRIDVMQSFDMLLKKLPAYDGLLVRTIDGFAYAKDHAVDKYIIGDASLYAYNSWAIAYYRRYFPGMQFIMPRELSYTMLKALWGKERSGTLVCDIYGNVPVMVSAQCLKKNVDCCNHQSEMLAIKDRKDVDYDVQCVCRYCYNLIYNGIDYSLFGLSDEVNTLMPGEIRLIFREEEASLVSELIDACIMEYKQGIKADVEALFLNCHKRTTRGHFRRGIE